MTSVLQWTYNKYVDKSQMTSHNFIIIHWMFTVVLYRLMYWHIICRIKCTVFTLFYISLLILHMNEIWANWSRSWCSAGSSCSSARGTIYRTSWHTQTCKARCRCRWNLHIRSMELVRSTYFDGDLQGYSWWRDFVGNKKNNIFF